MNTIATRPTVPPAPYPMPPMVARQVDSCLTALRPTAHPLQFSILKLNAPPPELRQAISTQIAAIDVWARPQRGDARRIVAAIGLLSSCMASRNSGQDTKSIILLYVNVLAEFPAWAVEETCTAYLNGKIGDGHWMPSPGEIANTCRERIIGLRAERDRIKRILAAEIVEPPPEPTAESKARVAAILQAFRREAA